MIGESELDKHGAGEKMVTCNCQVINALNIDTLS